MRVVGLESSAFVARDGGEDGVDGYLNDEGANARRGGSARVGHCNELEAKNLQILRTRKTLTMIHRQRSE